MFYDEKIEAAKKEAAGIIDTAKAEARSLNAEEIEKVEGIKAEIAALRKSAELDNLSNEWAEQEKADIRAARKIEAPAGEYADEQAERAALVDYIKRGQTEGTGAYGGYTVPTRIWDYIISKINGEAIIRQLATVVNISGPVTIPTEGTDITAYWTAEGAAYTEGTQQFGSAALTPYKLTVLDTITEELLNDTQFDLVGYLIDKIGRVIGETANTGYLKGSTGNNEPQGILSSGITVTRTASATAVTYNELMSLYYDLGEYGRNASWLISPALAASLSGQTTGTGGQFVWGNLAEGGAGQIMGRPAYICRDLDPIAANKIVAVVGDFKYYFIGDVNGVQFQRLNELYAASGKVGLRATFRTGGVLTNNDAFRVLGTKTS